MKKYLREIELAGMLLLAIGVVIAFAAGAQYGMWPCAVGLLLWVVTLVYKAFNWTEFAAENRRNIMIMLVAIVILILQMIWMR